MTTTTTFPLGAATAGPAARAPSATAMKQAVARFWGARSRAFDQGDSCITRTADLTAGWREVFAEAFGPAPQDVLDVGSGTGELALLFHAMGHRVRGIDLAAGMLDVAREKVAQRGIDIRFDLGDAESPQFADASFDVIHARHVIQLLPNPQAALREWVRILRPGGIVFLTASYDEGAPYSFGERIQQRVGLAVLRALHAVGLDPRPVLPPSDMSADWEVHFPLRKSLDADGLHEFLASAGLVDVTVRDLLELRSRGRSAMPWYRRWSNRRKRAYHGAWARKPDVTPNP